MSIFKGSMVAIATPMNEDGSLDFESYHTSDHNFNCWTKYQKKKNLKRFFKNFLGVEKVMPNIFDLIYT